MDISKATSVTDNAITINKIPGDNTDIKPKIKKKKVKELSAKDKLKALGSGFASLSKKLMNKGIEEHYEDYVFSFFKKHLII